MNNTDRRHFLERKETRLINENRFDEAHAVAREIDEVWEKEHPGTKAADEARRAAQFENDARDKCYFSDGDESTVDHDPRD